MEAGMEGRHVLRRLTAFTDDPAGGNPAGVWLGRELPSPADMQAIAAEVGYSETAFLAPANGDAYTVRYYSPKAEVTFCGHATIAAGALLGELRGVGRFRFDTLVGVVPVDVTKRGDLYAAALTSVDTKQTDATPALQEAVLAALGWSGDQLDPSIPIKLAWAGAWHLVIAVRDRATLDALDYDYDALAAQMASADLTTLQLVWREDETSFHSRNPFPPGGVREDPATGAAAAAFGGYLRDAGIVQPPVSLLIRQGLAMGRPSRIDVQVPESGGITVSGTAVSLDDPTPGSVAERLARSFLERVWRSPADLAAIDELMSEDYVLHTPGTILRGRAEFASWVAGFQERLEGATNEVHDVFSDADGTRVVARWTCRGLNRGIFGLPPDGRPVEFTGIAWWAVRDGRLAEGWVERSAPEAVDEQAEEEPAR